MICTWCKKEIKDTPVMEYINPRKKKNKQGNLKSKMPYHTGCIERKNNTKGTKIKGIVSGGLCNGR